MEWMTTEQAARQWNVTPRLVQSYCAQGRIEGAERFGRSWRIPKTASKPCDLRRTPRSSEGKAAQPRLEQTPPPNLMPLMNSAFTPGSARATAESFPEGARRDIALAELAYFSGDAERATQLASPHLASADFGTRLSSHFICAFSNLSLGRIGCAKTALYGARTTLAEGSQHDARLRAGGGFVARAASVLFHLPPPDDAPDAKDIMPVLPMGLKAFAFYVQAHEVYLAGDWARSLGIAETALLMQGESYPIPAIYLHLVAVMDCMSLRRADEARKHLLAAWKIAQPDGLIEGFGEHHGLLGGMLEAVIKPTWSEDFRRIIDITYRFSAGWRRVHNPATGDDVADNLTTTEFAASMLAARGWTNAEIAAHMGVSPNTVKSYISASLSKLGVASRQDLKRFMLA